MSLQLDVFAVFDGVRCGLLWMICRSQVELLVEVPMFWVAEIQLWVRLWRQYLGY